jgi:hypothetical protein
MSLPRLAALALLAGLVTAGCGQASDPAQPAAASTTTTMDYTAPVPINVVAPPTTTAAPTTTTAVCVPVDTTALRNYRDQVQASISQTDGAIAQIQLVIDNGTRSRASAFRYQTTVQADYDEAAAAHDILGLDSSSETLARHERRLADAKGIVASWDSTLTKARGDLARAKAQKAGFEQKVRETSAQIAAAPTCS